MGGREGWVSPRDPRVVFLRSLFVLMCRVWKAVIRHLAEPIVGRRTKNEHEHAGLRANSVKRQRADCAYSFVVELKKRVPIVIRMCPCAGQLAWCCQ